MPAGTQISGEDGIVKLIDADTDIEIGEIPCLVSWTLEASASIASRSTRCMKSNGDGGSDTEASWDKNTVEGKSWNVSANFFWQENQSIPASLKLDPTNVGQKVKLELYPNDSDSGKVVYSGTAIIESVSDPSEVTGDVKCDVTLRGDGALATDTVSA